MSTTQQPEALAADHSGDATDMVGRWYMVNKMGMATLCANKADAQQEAADAQRFWPHMGPHRAVQLVEAADVEAMRAGYDSARLEIESARAARAPADSVLEDAARYRWLRQHDGVDCTDDGEFIAGALSGITIGIDASCAQGIDGADLDAAIDAARAAQEGKSHGLKT